MEDNYIPYGPEWEKELMKLPKKLLTEMYRKSQIRLHAAERFIDESPCCYEITNHDHHVAYTEWMASKL